MVVVVVGTSVVAISLVVVVAAVVGAVVGSVSSTGSDEPDPHAVASSPAAAIIAPTLRPFMFCNVAETGAM